MVNLLKERLNRRKILKVAGGLLLASVFDLHRTPDGRAEMTRMRWIERDVFPDSGTYRSAVFAADQQFESVEVSWIADVPEGSSVEFLVRTSSDGDSWTDWEHLHRDTHIEPHPDGREYAMPHISGPKHYTQYELNLVAAPSGATPRIHEVELGCVDPSAGAQFQSVGGQSQSGWVITRAQWGANENLRFDDDGKEKWTPRYAPVQKVIIHHTVTSNGGSDPASVIRAIYYYHAVSLGWGDIGYNYLVDQNGRVFEGRHGGRDVIGAHTFGNNTGSMGIAAIGNFEFTATSQNALGAMGRVIGELAPHLDPLASGSFGNYTNVPNVCAHRDFMATECPGNGIYTRLPEIRQLATRFSPPPSSSPAPAPPPVQPASAEITDVRFMPETMYSGGTLRVDITVRNTGSTTVQTQGPPSNYLYQEDEDFVSAFSERIEGRFRVGIDFEGNSGLPNPWRWGLPGPLPPGESVTVTGFVRLRSIREWNVSACLVNELVRYEQRGLSPTRIVTQPPPTNPTGRTSDPSMHYFDTTSHNVPDIFYRYWEANGGLRRFGYPLTEAIMELSETDGETYLTQYFERARFEHHPEHAGTQYEVLLGLLGSERTAHRQGEPEFQSVPLPADTDGVDYFVETGHTLRGGFRTYWYNNGGLPVFGFPISERITERSDTDGQTYLVQYFERNRMEWHPEFEGTEHEILLGHLAREVLIDRGWLERGY
jgi:hypothetical protein